MKGQEISPGQLHSLLGIQTLHWFALEQLVPTLPMGLTVQGRIWALAWLLPTSE